MVECTVIKDELGERWYKKGTDLLHRGQGLPAVITINGDLEWWFNGLPHRWGGLPAFVWACGYQAWFVEGKRQRGRGLPAVVHSDGSEEYWWNNMLHRGGDLPAISLSDGYKEYWEYGVEMISDGESNGDELSPSVHLRLLKTAYCG